MFLIHVISEPDLSGTSRLFKAAGQSGKQGLSPELGAPESAIHICVSIGYTCSMKDAGLRIRVQRDLREQFLDACRTQDKPASQVLREFMREYAAEHSKEAEQPRRRKGSNS